MKIVIDIDEDIYFSSRQNIKFTDEQILNIDKAIYYGVVLPKDHGDLIDRSKLAYDRCPNNVKDCPSNYDFKCNNCDYGIIHKFKVDGADVVIPADRGDTE